MKFLVLGVGYVGSRILELHPQSIGLSRTPMELDQVLEWDPQKALQSIGAFGQTLDTNQWDAIILTFPAQNLEPLQRTVLKQYAELHSTQIIVIGSWSSLDSQAVVGIHPWVFKESCPRQDAELDILGEMNIRLLLAGIWGPHRSPLSWLQRGLIAQSKQGVHLIHVDDIVDFMVALVHKQFRGQVLLSDGLTHTWDVIQQKATELGALEPGFSRPEIPVKRPDRSIDPDYFLSLFQSLNWQVQHPYQVQHDLNS